MEVYKYSFHETVYPKVHLQHEGVNNCALHKEKINNSFSLSYVLQKCLC